MYKSAYVHTPLFAFMAGQLTESQGDSLDELCRTNGQDSEVAR